MFLYEGCLLVSPTREETEAHSGINVLKVSREADSNSVSLGGATCLSFRLGFGVFGPLQDSIGDLLWGLQGADIHRLCHCRVLTTVSTLWVSGKIWILIKHSQREPLIILRKILVFILFMGLFAGA